MPIPLDDYLTIVTICELKYKQQNDGLKISSLINTNRQPF